jgi:hypothetical protein
MKRRITHKRLLELLEYNVRTGEFVRKQQRGSHPAGTVAGTLDWHGYVEISIDGKKYGAHRLAWFYVYGKWPKIVIDHKNRVSNQNWLDNLREATHGQNVMNSKMFKSNSSGERGVYYYKKRNEWRAQIRINRRKITIGCYPTKALATAAYKEKAAGFFGEFVTRG